MNTLWAEEDRKTTAEATEQRSPELGAVPGSEPSRNVPEALERLMSLCGISVPEESYLGQDWLLALHIDDVREKMEDMYRLPKNAHEQDRLLLAAASIVEDYAECLADGYTLGGGWNLKDGDKATLRAWRDWKRYSRIAERLRYVAGRGGSAQNQD
jgi:hypothetical protein